MLRMYLTWRMRARYCERRRRYSERTRRCCRGSLYTVAACERGACTSDELLTDL